MYCSVKRCVYVQDACQPCLKRAHNLAKRCIFISVIQNTHVIVGLTLLTGTKVLLCAHGKKSSMVDGIQYGGGISSIRWKVFSADVSHHRYGGEASSVQWRV